MFDPRPCLALSCLVLAVALFHESSASADDDDVIANMTAVKIERILNSFNDVTNLKELDDGTYIFETAGMKVIIFNKGQTMQLYAAFSGKITLSRINEWNRTKRFTRAYADEEGDPCLEADLELTGGVTERNVKEWMKTFVLCLKAFKEHIE